MLNGCAMGIMKVLVVAILLTSIICSLCGCKHIEYVSVPEIHTDTLYVSKTQHDSVYVKDSVFLHEYTKGDTIFVEKLSWQTKWREKVRIDTIYKSRVDSVNIPYPVEVVKTKTNYGGWVAFSILLLAALAALYIFLRKRK